MLREDGEDRAEERSCGEQGGECARGVVFALGVGFEDVAGEHGGVFVYTVSEED